MASTPLFAQSRRPPTLHVTAGSEAENYLRALQIVGVAPEYPWSLRAFSRRELDSLTRFTGPHPWAARYSLGTRGNGVSVLPFEVGTVVNSNFPWGVNDGPVWAGRGVTASASAGVHGGLGALSFALNPIAFRAANTSFELAPNGETGLLAYGDPQHARRVDRPQRFGEDPYARVDPGNSYARLDFLGITAGVSSANEFWGPAARYPFVLGNNAPGFLHGFLGTSRPVNVGIGRAHARIQWGRLEQSAYSPVTGSSSYVSDEEPGHSRFAPGLVFVFQPRGAPGLELGVSRFFHLFIREGGIPGSYWTKPLRGFFRHDRTSEQADSVGVRAEESNQLASMFARWVFPAAGLEAYAEYGREDYNADLRDLIQEPDHQRSYMVGLAKAFISRSGRLHAIRGELINFQIPGMARTRNQGSVYLHTKVRQGHTNRGQLLGAPVGVDAAAGSSITWDSYSSGGRWSLRWARTTARERGGFYRTEQQTERAIDATHELDASRVFFTRLGDLSIGGALVRELNRNFQDDAWNFQTRFGVRKAF